MGQPSSIDDSEALDEINLNTSSEDSAILGGSSPYRGPGPDPNANPLLEPPPGVGNDSLLSQAASSFTALPSVASNVFSSFSKRIYAGGSREQSEEPRLDIQPAYIQQFSNGPPPPEAVAPVPAPFYAGPPPAANEVVAPEPPKFYAPTEVPSSNPGAAAPPPTAGNPNSYRFTARKKLYAPIPGLSEQQAAQAPQVQAQPLPFQTPPYPPQPTQVATPNPPPFDISAQPAPNPVEERQSGRGLFSLTSLVPQGVLQNISGLVQSVTGNQDNQPANNQPSSSGGYFDIASGGQPAPATNFFEGPTPAPPPASNYFTPGGASESVAAPPVGGFFAPPASVPGPLEGNPLLPAAPIPGPVGLFTPGAAPQAVGQVFSPPSSIPGAPPTSAAGFFNPGLAPPAVATPPLAPPSAGPPPSHPPASVPGNFFTPGVVPAVAPTATPPPAAGGFLPTNPSPLPSGPPVAAAAPPPAAGQASYRLQKGTRLYKSPLTAQETAAPSGYSAPLAPTAAPAAIFNPFGAPAPGAVNPVADNSQGVALFPPSAAVVAPPPSVANAPPSGGLASVPLFAAPLTPSGIPFFNPQPSAEVKQEDPQAQVAEGTPQVQEPPVGLTSVPLFDAPPTGSSAIQFFNPQPPTEVRQEVPPVQVTEEAPQPPAQALFANPEIGQGVTSAVIPPPPGEAYPPPTGPPLFAAPPTGASAIPFFNPQPTAEVPPGQGIEGQAVQDQPSTQGTPFFAPPPAATSGVALFTPQPTHQLGEEKDQGLGLFAPPPPPSQPGVEPPQEATKSVPLFGAALPADNPLFAPLFVPGVIEPVIEDTPPPSASLFAPVSEPDQGAAQASAGAPSNQDPPLFVPVPAPADQSPGVPLYPPVASEVAPPPPASSTTAPFAPDLISKCAPDLVASSLVPPATANVLFSPPDTVASSASLFAATIPTESQPEIEATPVAEPPTAPPAIGFFGAPEATTASLFTGGSGTQTVFSPLAQTITTPQVQETGQDLVPPPIGFVSPGTEGEVVAQPPPAPSPLHSFFGAPAAGASASAEEFNFFANPTPGGVFPDLPVQQGIAPPPLAQEPPPADKGATPVASLGFDSLLTQSQQAPRQTPNSIENSYPNSSANSFEFFGGAGAPPLTSAVDSPPAAVPLADPGNFFDQVPPEQEQPGNEDQRIQNFFNNPPLQDQPAGPGELKYDIVHSGLAVKELQERSQTPVSNLVEPPSSACSEFSTLAPARQTGEDLIQQHLGELPEEILKQLRMATANGSSDKGQVSAPPPVAIVSFLVLPSLFLN